MRAWLTDRDETLHNGPLLPPARDIAPGVVMRLGVSAPAAAPAQFAPAQWSVEPGTSAGQIVLTIIALPDDGGSPITALQYNVGAGWVALSGTGTGARTITLTPGQEYLVTVRAVNSVGAGDAAAAREVEAYDPPQLSDYYGIGPGQIPVDWRMHDPAHMTLDGSGAVTAIENAGGAGAGFALSSSAPVPRSDNGLLFSGTSWLNIASNIDANGVHLLAAVRAVEESAGNNPIAGGGAAMTFALAGTTNLSFSLRNSLVNPRTVTTTVSDQYAWHLFEMRYFGGSLNVWCDGALIHTSALADTATLFDRLAWANIGGTRMFHGHLGWMTSIICEAGRSAASPEPAVLLARQTLAAQYGVTLP